MSGGFRVSGPEGKEWLYEIKHDGYRAIVIKQGNSVPYFPGTGSCSPRSPTFTGLNAVRVKQFILDGECVVLDDEGRPSFALMQGIRKNKRPATFYAFDVLHLNGDNLLSTPLADRRRLLDATFTHLPDRVRLSPVLNGSAKLVLAKLKELEFEGIFAKRWRPSMSPGNGPGPG
jgi:bifunctional non-homologous end joining protein LigD